MTAEIVEIGSATVTLQAIKPGIEIDGRQLATGDTFRTRHKHALLLLRSGACDLVNPNDLKDLL